MPRETVEVIVTELGHEEDWRRMRATATCLKGGPKVVDLIIKEIQTGSPSYKIEAARMLARIRDPRAGVPLVKLLAGEEEGVREAVAASLEQMAGILDEPTAAALVELLKEEALRPQVTALLGVIPTSIEPLTRMLKDPDEEARIKASEILDHLLDPRSADALVDAMGDPSIRDMAVQTLKKLGAIRDRIDQVMNQLSSVEESELREGARQEAVISLHPIGRPAVEILIEYLEDDDWVVREAAADVLGKIGDVRAVEPLIARLRKDPDTGVKELAAKGLGLIGDSRPVDLLIDMIPIKPLRVLAVEALEKIKDIEALRPHAEVFKRLKNDRDGLVSYNSGVIIDKLEAAAAQLDEEFWLAKENVNG
ncbi:HEAT repeat domain-containing protein [Candidatus Nitronereus thalassa]|uniref:HEAT repeat domain-containing protein n=1 Tax=Candidatus Nitronereus thalassa TaxID=3020898 RepID=A0ABU3K8K7_9BACT|nr:HEAT repeat domain-containing protein [Candidatus Nitronereus thalassa]MDT7042723.1 HEAT repeat domain-containing protein [Candidatus Nitronereus thalassa]